MGIRTKTGKDMFVVKKNSPGKPMEVSDKNQHKNGMLSNNLSREGWRKATEEEMKKYYPEYKQKVKKEQPKAEPKNEAKIESKEK